jgi:hypothetical protein
MTKFMLAVVLVLGAFRVANARLDDRGDTLQNCPTQVQGAKVAVSDTANGSAVTITTESGKVAELRRGVKLITKMREANEEKLAMMPNWMWISAAVKYEQVPKGARLTLTPKDPTQLCIRVEAFRKQVREYAELMQKGDCSMMQRMMGGKQKQEPSTKGDSRDSLHRQ